MIQSAKKGADMENQYFLINNKWLYLDGANDRNYYIHIYK